jgi:hypothetical protein
LCEEARSRSHQLLAVTSRVMPRKFKGTLRGRTAWRRTVWARVRGQSSHYLESGARNMISPRPCLDCGVVFVLDECPSADLRSVADWWLDDRVSPQRRIYANFVWMASEPKRGSIRESRVAVRVRLYRKLRPTFDKPEIFAMLDALPVESQCTVLPWDDSDLKLFHATPVQLAVAAAIKWTIGGHITVVSATPNSDWPPALLEYARANSVRVTELSTYQFRDPLTFDRLAIDTEVPARNPWEPPHPYYLCQCRPVPGFDGAEVREATPGSRSSYSLISQL